MSTAAALPTGINLAPAAAVPGAGALAASAVPVAGDPPGDGSDPALAFQLLITEFGNVPPPDVTLGGGTVEAAASTETDSPHDRHAKADSNGDLSLLDVMAALSAWQLPVAPAVMMTTTLPKGGDSGSAAEMQPITVDAAAVAATAIAALRIDGQAQQTAQQPAQQLAHQGAGDTAPAKAADTDATLTAIATAAGATQAATVPDSQWTEAFAVAATTVSPTLRPKLPGAATDSLVASVDAATGGNLLRMPVVSSAVTRTVPVPVHDARWPEAVATQIRWAVADGVQSASLKLVPEHLGPVELHIELKDNQVNVNFGASQADTRQALQDSLPRLREVLAGAGIMLGQANVQQDSRHASQSGTSDPRLPREEMVEPTVMHTRIALGLVDEYA